MGTREEASEKFVNAKYLNFSDDHRSQTFGFKITLEVSQTKFSPPGLRVDIEWFRQLEVIGCARPDHRGPLVIADRRCSCRTPRFPLPQIQADTGNSSCPRSTGPLEPFSILICKRTIAYTWSLRRLEKSAFQQVPQPPCYVGTSQETEQWLIVGFIST